MRAAPSALILAGALSLAMAAAPPQASRPLRAAIEALEAGRIEVAIAQLDALVALHPSDPRVRYELGRALHAAGRDAEALEHLRAGVASASDPAAFDLVMAQALIELDRLREAREALSAAAILRPDYPPIRYQMARVCYRAGNVDRALEEFAKTAELAPSWPAPWLAAAELRAAENDPAAVAELIHGALEIDPSRADLWVRYGDALAALPDPEHAEAAYRNAVDRAPDQLTARLSLAYFLFNERRFDEAAEALADVLARFPDNPLALLPLAETQMVQGKDEEALAALEKMTAKPAPAPGATDDPGGDLPESLRLDALELQARALLSLGRLADAESAAREVLAARPGSLEALFTRATALVRSDDPEGRRLLLEYRTRSNVREHRELGWDYLRRGHDPDRAEAEFRRALAIDPQDADSLTGLGAALLAQDHGAEALVALDEAGEAGADDSTWARNRVLALHALGRDDEARQAWQAARARGWSLGPRVRAAVGGYDGAC